MRLLSTILGCAAVSAASAALRGSGVHAGSTVVHAPVGPIVGSVTDGVSTFRKVPFAKPPVGDLRFEAPQPIPAWGMPYNASIPASEMVGCIQRCVLPPGTCPPIQSEDCLYLNVFSPANVGSDAKLPVLFFIPGGDWIQGYGGGILYDGSTLAREQNAVVVSINYRLGAFGFLYSSNNSKTSIQGNFAIQDQRVALEWTRDNIAAFGGDPQNVLLWGQSAGSCSVATHLISPLSTGLFSRAMLLSNPLGLTYRDAENQAHVAVTLAKKAGCPTSPLADMETCIRGLPTSTLLAAQLATETDFWDDLSQIDQLFLAWTPVLGTPEAPMKPMDAFTSGQWPSAGVPISINTVANEAVMFVWELSKKPLNSLLYNLLIDGIYPWHHAEIKQRYPLPANETADTRLHAASIVTPSLFRCAARHAARYMSQVSPVWVSEFDHIQSFAPAMWGPNYTECNTVVCHGSDLVEWFLPDVSSMGVQFTPAELALGHAMQHHMMNFGQPGRSGAWPEFNNATNTAAVLRTPAPEVVPNFDDDECNFWDSVGYNWY